MKRRTIRRLTLAACGLVLCALGMLAGYVASQHGGVAELPARGQRDSAIKGPADPLRTGPDRYPWTALPEPAFPIPNYARYLRGVSIVLDPGHVGQSEKGRPSNWKRGPTGLREAEVNLRVAGFLREFLVAAGASVTLTRDKDEPRDISDAEDLAERVRVANKGRADLFLSIHHNGVESPEPNYTTVFYHGDGSANPASLSAARHILFGLNDALRLENLTEVPLWSDVQIYAKSGFGVLRSAEVPAVLSEASFHTNPNEEQRLRDPLYNRREAHGMFLGLARWAQAGLPRVELMEPANGRIARGKTVTLQLDDGLSKRDGRGPRAVRVLVGSLRIELDGRPLNYLSLNQQKGELRIAVPADTSRGAAALYVDFQNVFGQHVTHPRVSLQVE